MGIFLSALTIVLISGFMAVLVSLFLWHVPEGNRETLVYMAGQLSGFTSAAIAYWYNTTHGSARKTELLSKAEPVKE
jgi:hypothetical protein